MNSLVIAIVIAALMLASGVGGLWLQRLLPEPHTSDRSRDMIGSVAGLLTLLLALVLGLLIWTGYGVLSSQKTALQSLVSRSLQFDQTLAEYGPEAKGARAVLKDQATRDLKLFWDDNQASVNTSLYTATLANVSSSLANMHERDQALDGLQPTTETQKRLVATARQLSTSMGQTRLQMALQMDNPLPLWLLAIVVSWSLLLFCGFGLLSRANPTTIVALAFGAFSVTSAIFLILELSQPYTGVFRVSPAFFERLSADLDK